MKLYKHYRNGKLYEIVDRCIIQENDEWVEAVIYRCHTHTMKFCRNKKEFEDKFKEV